MKSLIFIALLVNLALAEKFFDYTKVIPRTEVPGFWHGRIIKPLTTSKFTRSRIVGGEETAPNAHPYQVGLLISVHWWTAMCGGCLISENLVLTAAHCPEDSTQTQVILGAHRLFSVEETQVRMTVQAQNYIVHPEYDAPMLYNDIALLILPKAAPKSPFIQPIALPGYEQLKKDFAGEVATVSGWGRTSDSSGATSPVLRYTQNEVKENQACYDIFGHFVIESTLCTITRSTNSGICNGDSGGPLTVERNGKLVLIGVVSYGALAGCQLGYPTGFARMTYFAPWINEFIKIHG